MCPSGLVWNGDKTVCITAATSGVKGVIDAAGKLVGGAVSDAGKLVGDVAVNAGAVVDGALKAGASVGASVDTQAVVDKGVKVDRPDLRFKV